MDNGKWKIYLSASPIIELLVKLFKNSKKLNNFQFSISNFQFKKVGAYSKPVSKP